MPLKLLRNRRAAPPLRKADFADLPPEVFLAIIQQFDNSTPEGRHALAACALVSKAWRSVVEPVLYSNFKVNPKRLNAFLLDLLGRGRRHGTATRAAQERTCTRLQWIKRLEIYDPPTPPGLKTAITLLWEAAATLNSSPLFSSVRQLKVTSPVTLGPEIEYRERYLPLDRIRPEEVSPNGALIFDDIDICVTGYPAYDLPSWLPVRHCRSLTAHDIRTLWVEQLGLGRFRSATTSEQRRKYCECYHELHIFGYPIQYFNARGLEGNSRTKGIMNLVAKRISSSARSSRAVG